MEIYVKDRLYLVENAEEMDQSEIQQLIFNILVEYGLKPEPEGIDVDLYNLKQSYQNGYFGVLRNNYGIIIGTMGLYKISETKIEIRKMYLNKDFRGLGLGSWMVDFLINKARKMNFKVLELETASVLVEAISLYRKFGFQEVKIANSSPRCDKCFVLKL